MTPRNGRESALDTLVVLSATVVLLGGFVPLFTGAGWVVDVLAVLVPVALVIILVRAVAPAWATAAGAGASAVMITWVFAPGTTVFGVPTRATMASLGDHLDRARTVIVEETSPLDPPPAVLLVVAIAFVVMFVLADAVARQSWRVPLLGMLWTTMLVVPSIIAMQMPPWWVFVVTALAWLWLWWSQAAHVGHLPRGAAAVTGVGALVVGLVLPMVTPHIEPTSSDFGVADSEVFGRGINPMIELGRNLRQSDPRRVLTYTSEVTEGHYLKVATLRQFTGRTWAPSPIIGDLDVEGIADLSDDVESEEVTTSVQIESLRSTLLPVPYPATQIRGLEGDWQWLRDGNTVRATGRTTTEDQTYTVTSLDRRPTADQVRGTPTPGRALDSYRTLPSGVPPIVRNLAFEHGGDERTDYDRMLALQDWLRSEFSYSEEAPVEHGYDGNGLDVMGEFLQRGEGYCVHFASTLAVMGRVLDVPTRVAVGYAPGGSTVQRTPDTVTYGVDSDDLHAWTEVYFEELGWIPFDATPGIGSATGFEETFEAAGGNDTDAPAPETDGRESPQTLDPEQDAATPVVDEQADSSWRPAALAIVIVALLGAVPGVARQVRRRRRWSASRTSAELLWTEVAETARDLGIELDPAETPRGFARRLRKHGAEPESLDRLVAGLEGARYAGVVTAPRVDEARRVVGSLEDASDRRSRWLARIAPRSLMR